MPEEVLSSFQELSDAQFKTHTDAIIAGHLSSTERKASIAYIQQVQSSDAAALEAERKILWAKRRENGKKQRQVEKIIESQAFDFSKHAVLFDAPAITDSQVATKLTQDNAEVYVVGRTMTANVVISGDNVLLEGSGDERSAREGLLTNTCVITGQIQVSGDNVTIRGIDFVGTLQDAIIFTAACET